MAKREPSREYWSNSSDPHKVGPVRVTLAEEGLVIAWAGDTTPIIALKPAELMDLARVTAADNELQHLRELALDAVATIETMRDEMRGMLGVVKASTAASAASTGARSE